MGPLLPKVFLGGGDGFCEEVRKWKGHSDVAGGIWLGYGPGLLVSEGTEGELLKQSTQVSGDMGKDSSSVGIDILKALWIEVAVGMEGCVEEM
jgi:hypothetical protein